MNDFILQSWDDFAAEVLTGAPAMQRDEMKKAFFAGAAGLWRVINENPGIKTFDQIHREFVAYNKLLQKLAESFVEPQPTTKPPVQVEQMRKIEAMARDAFRTLDNAIGGVLNRREIGAALFLFSFTGAEITYVSNAQRPDMMKMLQEFLMANPPELTWDEQHG